jgi:hypothetical protein
MEEWMEEREKRKIGKEKRKGKGEERDSQRFLHSAREREEGEEGKREEGRQERKEGRKEGRRQRYHHH